MVIVVVVVVVVVVVCVVDTMVGQMYFGQVLFKDNILNATILLFLNVV